MLYWPTRAWAGNLCETPVGESMKRSVREGQIGHDGGLFLEKGICMIVVDKSHSSPKQEGSSSFSHNFVPCASSLDKVQ